MKNKDDYFTPEQSELFRLNAERLLNDGIAPSSGSGVLGIETLELLYRWSSNPDYAADAIKLLHELRTHQVELDLLYDQKQSDDEQLEDELTHYRAIYDLAPVPYLIVDRAGQISESNQAAAKLFDMNSEQLSEHLLTDLLALSSRTTVYSMLKDLNASLPELSCKALRTSNLDLNSHLILKAKLGISSEQIFLVVLPDSPLIAN